MNVAIVGANGFLGRSLVSLCLGKKWHVYAIYHESKNNIPVSCQKAAIDTLKIPDKKTDLVFLSVGNSRMNLEQLIHANIFITQKICTIFPSAKIVFISSVAVYGVSSKKITENTPYGAQSTYGLSKIAGELIVSSRLRYAICRLTSLYGSGADNRAFIQMIISEAQKKKTITLLESNRVQDYLHVEDAAEFCIKAGITKKNGTFLGATGNSVSNICIAKEIQKHVKKCSIDSVNSVHSPSFRYDPSETKKVLCWNPKHAIMSDIPNLLKQ